MENKPMDSLLREIQVCDFALTEARLFLDTHPYDQQAIQFYQQKKERLAQLKAEWEARCGCVQPRGNEARWAWVDTPWPWQVEG